MLSKHASNQLLAAGRRELPRAGARIARGARALATPAAAPPSPNDPFANGTNAYYIEEMYRHWREDPKSVHVSWDVYFSGMDKGLPSQQAFTPPPNIAPSGGVAAPSLHAAGGGELDAHLKVCVRDLCRAALVLNVATGPASRARIPGPRPPCRRPGPARHPRRRPREQDAARA
jgi:hypothetical protein